MGIIGSIIGVLNPALLAQEPIILFFISLLLTGLIGDGAFIALIIFGLNFHLSIGLIFLGAYVGVILGDSMWFFIGRKFIGHFKKYDKVKSPYKHLAKFIYSIFQGKHFLALLTVKFIFGTRIITIAYLSDKRLSFRRFTAYNLITNLVWLFFVGLMGLLVGWGFMIIKTANNIQIALLFVIVFFIILYLIHKKIRKKLIKN